MLALIAMPLLQACARGPGVDCTWSKVSHPEFDHMGDLEMFDSGYGVALFFESDGPYDVTWETVVAVTEDAGLTWTETNRTENGWFSNLHAFDESRILVGGRGMKSSSDGGQTWTDEIDGFEQWVGELHFWDDQIGVSVGDYGVNRSEDGGETWGSVLETAAPLESLTIGPNGMVSTMNPDALFVSGDRGATWSRLPTPQPLGDPTAAFVTEDQGVISTGDILWFTANGGTTWTRSHPSAMVLPVSDAVWLDENRGWLIGQQLYRTKDGGQTVSRVEGPPIPLTARMDITESGSTWLATGNDGLWKCE
jgi:photosystem II stability/assembly factor-like uncharacterized protein